MHSVIANLKSSGSIAIFGLFGVLIGMWLCSFIFKEMTENVIESLNTFYLKLKEDIKYSVAPKSIQLSLAVNDLVELAIEIWRLEQRLNKAASSITESQRTGIDNSLKKLRRYVEKYDIEIRDYSNQKYNDGLNLDILSVEKDPSINAPMIKETIEPTILCKGEVVRKAKIILINRE